MSVPVILLTVLSSSEDMIKGLECGADSFISKPYSEDYLVNLVEKTIEKKVRALGRHQSQVAQWPNWAEWMRKRAETAGASQGIKYAEAFKRLILS